MQCMQVGLVKSWCSSPKGRQGCHSDGWGASSKALAQEGEERAQIPESGSDGTEPPGSSSSHLNRVPELSQNVQQKLSLTIP